MIYFWTEDRKDKSGYQFWEKFLSVLYPQIVLESKTNSSELVKSVTKIDSDDTYIIALDHSFDNDQSVREVSILRKVIQKKSNVHELNLISFEFVLLSLPFLLDWIYSEQDEFREKEILSLLLEKKYFRLFKSRMTIKPVLKFWSGWIKLVNIILSR